MLLCVHRREKKEEQIISSCSDAIWMHYLYEDY